jgi:hypothetical protein
VIVAQHAVLGRRANAGPSRDGTIEKRASSETLHVKARFVNNAALKISCPCKLAKVSIVPSGTGHFHRAKRGKQTSPVFSSCYRESESCLLPRILIADTPTRRHADTVVFLVAATPRCALGHSRSFRASNQ